ncbi:hypothetical protein PIB30_018719 [Stylosanthes scabra]|uniref:Transposase, Ptta/En/Spm, plant n=1 Tax=Stylosanthes scabra TaxID=79078 RepID=A0ABU6X6Y0_9FABA|nr:hypothetical protein [Stylosanthes scabra]
MPRRPRYPKISNLATSKQHPHEEAPVASSIQWDDPPISSAGGGVPAATSCRPFHPPRKPWLVHNRLFEASDAGNCRGRRNANHRLVNVFETDGTIKEKTLTVAQAMKPSHGTKVILSLNQYGQPIDDDAALLSRVLGVVGSNFDNFPIFEENWRVMSTKESVYNDILKKEARNRLWHEYYDSRKSLDQNVLKHPRGVNTNDWRRFLMYHLRPDTQEKLREPIEAAIHSHRRFQKPSESRQQGRAVSRGEVWMMTHKKNDGSYIHEDARGVFGKEHSCRVRGIGFGPIPSELFGSNSQQPDEGDQAQETRRVLEELQAELRAEKLKRQAIENEVTSKKVKRQKMENALRYLIQQQVGNLPADIIDG